MTEGVAQLKDIMVTTRIPAARQKAVAALSDAIPIIEKLGDQQMTDKKYTDAINTYEQGIRAAMLLARAHGSDTLGPEANPMMRGRRNQRRREGCGHARCDLQAVRRHVIGVYPDDKVANIELAFGLPRQDSARLRYGGGISKSAAARPTTRFANFATSPRSIASDELERA